MMLRKCEAAQTQMRRIEKFPTLREYHTFDSIASAFNTMLDCRFDNELTTLLIIFIAPAGLYANDVSHKNDAHVSL